MGTMCGKSCYDSKKQAITVINYIRRNKNRKKFPVRSYFCNKCNAWHITSEEKEKEITFTFRIPEDNKIIHEISKILGEK